jgi:hypothetical protein
MKILLGDINSKVGRENILKTTIGNESLHQDINDNDARIICFATSKNLFVKSTTFLYRNIQMCTWISPDGQTHNQNDYVFIDRRWHWNVLDVRSFREANCETDHYLVVAKVRERLAVIKQVAQKLEGEILNLRKLN